MQNRISVIIADDHPIFRLGLVSILSKNRNINIVGQAENGELALSLVSELEPNVAILDVEMPLLSGLQICEHIKAEGYKTKVIILTLFKEEDLYYRAIELGACGYVLKEHSLNEIGKAVEIVGAGGKYVSEALALNLKSNKSNMVIDPKVADALAKLSNTELKILKFISQRLSSKEIASKLFISSQTVDSHRYHISKKLKLEPGQNNLLKFAFENNVLL